jgi:glycerol-3-phosphate acyltransferase PlsX
VFEFVMGMVSREMIGALDAERERAAAAVKGLLARYHYSTFGGAPLLGVDGVCVICHGSSDERAIANALGVAAHDVRVRLNEKIVAELEALPAAGEDD